MHRRIGDAISPDQFMLLIDIHMILAAIVTFAMIDRPAGFGILLPVLRRLRVPIGRTVARFDRGVFVTKIAWVGTGIREASSIWPTRAYKPWVAKSA